MNAGSPSRDYLLPRLTQLVNGAVAHGIPHDVVVAVLIDLITSTTFDTAAPDMNADSALDLPPWQFKEGGGAPT